MPGVLSNNCCEASGMTSVQIVVVIALVAFLVGAVLAAVRNDYALAAVAIGLVALTWLVHPLNG